MKTALKSLADVKRTIKVGTLLMCVEHTLRPELNGRVRRVRRVVKAQSNSFEWVHDPVSAHELVVKSLRPLVVKCACGDFHYSQTAEQRESQAFRGNRESWTDAEDQYGYHAHRATSRSWTTYEKASAFTFDGDAFTMQLKPGTHVTLRVLPESEAA